MIIIGVDPGKDTGLAGWDVAAQKLLFVESMLIHRAFERVLEVRPALVIFEDARQRNWFGVSGKEKLQGAGSIKRDSTIWEDFLTDHALQYVARKPAAGGTKWDSIPFGRLTQWKGRTNEHARDAAMIVYQLNKPMIEGMMRMHS